jgi:hypothetical protein
MKFEDHDDTLWRARSFGARAEAEARRRLGCPGNLIPAPRRTTRSFAMQEWQEAHARADARQREELRRHAEHVRRLGASTPPEPIESLIAKFGADTVRTLMRRYVDPQFDLPAIASKEQEQ